MATTMATTSQGRLEVEGQGLEALPVAATTVPRLEAMEATKARGRELTVAIRAAVARAMVEIKPASAQAPTGQIPMDVQLVPKA